jgi:hypothetical protein
MIDKRLQKYEAMRRANLELVHLSALLRHSGQDSAQYFVEMARMATETVLNQLYEDAFGAPASLEIIERVPVSAFAS